MSDFARDRRNPADPTIEERALQSEGQTYIYRFSSDRVGEVADAIRRDAANPELDFSTLDAAMLLDSLPDRRYALEFAREMGILLPSEIAAGESQRDASPAVAPVAAAASDGPDSLRALVSACYSQVATTISTAWRSVVSGVQRFMGEI